MKKLFFAALIALAGFTACGTKNVETAATEATEQREVGGGDIAYVQVEAVLAQSDLYNAGHSTFCTVTARAVNLR